MKKEYVNVIIGILEEYFDLSMSVLQDYNFCGIEERSDELIVSFEETEFDKIELDELINELKTFDKTVKLISIEKFSERNWNEEWEKHVLPVIVSDKIIITPTHRASESDAEITIVIDPKMSFGTGHHTTTRLVCKLMDGLVKPHSHWIDAGTGTGVLAILAVKLGAESVYAFDNNEWSINNAQENIIKNEVDGHIRLELADIDSLGLETCDGIAANIFLNLALPSLPKFRQAIEKNDGDLLISGIMVYDEEILLKQAKKDNLILVNKIVEDEWVAFHFKCGEKS